MVDDQKMGVEIKIGGIYPVRSDVLTLFKSKVVVLIGTSVYG